MARVRLLPAALLVAVAAATAGACGSTGGNAGAGATVTTTVTTQSPPPPPPPTPTAPAATRTTTATTAAPPPPPPAPADAATVVGDYFAAINAHDYGRAWALGGKNLDSSYSHFVSGFSDTTADIVTVLAATPTTVTLHLDALQSNGTTKSFEGTYTVSNGTITRAGVHAVADTGPQTGAPATSYADCTDAHNHGATSIPSTDPRYQSKLDRDNDGLACEPREFDTP
ncbi:excalibur calcium-binding domain-containing protein [Actinacidiphila alni]|uniref:excalibur calcium-binding domain-containing protein n=1 Tax=Actinacidiphila alni TaxID=380248 RepID=UPI0033D493AE